MNWLFEPLKSLVLSKIIIKFIFKPVLGINGSDQATDQQKFVLLMGKNYQLFCLVKSDKLTACRW